MNYVCFVYYINLKKYPQHFSVIFFSNNNNWYNQIYYSKVLKLTECSTFKNNYV